VVGEIAAGIDSDVAVPLAVQHEGWHADRGQQRPHVAAEAGPEHLLQLTRTDAEAAVATPPLAEPLIARLAGRKDDKIFLRTPPPLGLIDPRLELLERHTERAAVISDVEGIGIGEDQRRDPFGMGRCEGDGVLAECARRHHDHALTPDVIEHREEVLNEVVAPTRLHRITAGRAHPAMFQPDRAAERRNALAHPAETWTVPHEIDRNRRPVDPYEIDRTGASYLIGDMRAVDRLRVLRPQSVGRCRDSAPASRPKDGALGQGPPLDLSAGALCRPTNPKPTERDRRTDRRRRRRPETTAAQNRDATLGAVWRGVHIGRTAQLVATKGQRVTRNGRPALNHK
jgi:hypothetical protein